MELESIMLSEINQAVKDKYYMILPMRGNWSTKQTSKKNITKDIEIKNRLTVTKGRWEGITGMIREGSSRNMYKGHMDKAKGGRIEGGRWRMGGVWGVVVGEMETTLLEQQYKKIFVKKTRVINDAFWMHMRKWNGPIWLWTTEQRQGQKAATSL